MIAPGLTSQAGYDPSGRFVALQPRNGYAPHDILDLQSGERVRIRRDANATWVAPETLLVAQEGSSVYVAASDGRTWHAADSALDRAPEILPDPSGTRVWAVTTPQHLRPDEAAELVEFELPSGTATGRSIRVPGKPYVVATQPDGTSLWVNYYIGEPGSWLAYEDETSTRGAVFDIATGEHGPEVLAQNSAADPSDPTRVVVSDFVGGVREVALPDGRQVATVPGARGVVYHLRFSSDGSRFLATGVEPWVTVYDTDGWDRLGSIPSEPSQGGPGGHLRPDGRALLVNTGRGVVEWTLGIEELATAACELAGRNLTRGEWATYLGDEPYRATCPQFPVDE
jgi:hypothetical protein